MNYLLITNQPDVAKHVADRGVKYIFVDLEKIGKQVRQGHLDTLISRHVIGDVSKVKSVLPDDTTLLVRVNPYGSHSAQEIEDVINAGADILMLPMFRTLDEVIKVGELIDGRAGFMPLVETHDAFKQIKDVAKINSVTETYIGLNDLRIDMGADFLFEPLANGMLDVACAALKQIGKPFGFGGIARVGEGNIPGEMILGEHLRLGSTRVILSRTFHRKSETLEQIRGKMDFSLEMEKLFIEEKRLSERSIEEQESDKALIQSKINEVVEMVREKTV